MGKHEVSEGKFFFLLLFLLFDSLFLVCLD